MNKQLTKKTIGIAASAALMASLALSGSAFAAPGNGNGGANGKKGSIEILSICDLNKASGDLTVWTKIVDTSSDPANYGANLDSMFVQAYEKVGTGKSQSTNDLGLPGSTDPEFDDDFSFDDCRDAVKNGTLMPDSCNEITRSVCGLSAGARSVNADIEVLIDGIHNNKEVRFECDYQGADADGNCIGETFYWSVFTANCSDDPLTDADEMAGLNVWKKDVCTTP
jgi:hypothetical protein